MRRIAAALVTLSAGVAALLPGSVGRAANPPPPATAAATPAVGAPPTPAPAVAPPAAQGVEPKITVPGAEGDYLRTLHQRIHFRFVYRFIQDVASKRPATDPLNQPNLRAEILFGVRWDGSVSDVIVGQKSGVDAFDQAAIAAVRVEGDRYPPPPAELFGDDGVAHFRWVFARNHELCGDGAVRRVEAPLAQALPRLFVEGRIKEAMLRAARDSRAGSSNAMGTFALAWLQRPQTDPAADARAAAALLRFGDKKMQTKAFQRIKPAIARQETAAIAAPALAAYATAGGGELDTAGFCSLLGGPHALREGDPAARERALNLLRDSGVKLPQDSPCAKALAENAGDTATPGRLRALSLATLGATTGGVPGKLVRESMEDKDPSVRAAGATVFAKPGAGRPALYRLQPPLHDSSPDVRPAAAGGLVRACGALALPFVQPMFKERDDRALVAMAPELGRLKSPESADMLAKMMSRPGGDLRLAVTRGLADRKDDPGKALRAKAFDTIRRDPYASPELRGVVYADASPDELLKQPRDPLLGPMGYKALLRAKRHSEAIDWLVANFDRQSSETAVDLLAAWLANAPGAGPPPPAKRAG